MLKKRLGVRHFLSAAIIALFGLLPNVISAQTIEQAVLSAAWSPDGTLLATLTHKGTFEVVIPSQNTLIFQFTRTVPDLVKAAVSWSPDGNYLATGIGNRMYIWDVVLWQLLYEYEVGSPSGLFFDSDLGDNNPEGVQNITWSLDGRYVVAGTYSYEIMENRFRIGIIWAEHIYQANRNGTRWLKGGLRRL